MSSFYCEHCGAEILDSPTGYTTGCKHYPLEDVQELDWDPDEFPSEEDDE